MNISEFVYHGSVEVKIKVKDKIITIARHNAGTENLFRAFAKFLTNNANYREDAPQYLDVQKKSGSNWISVLADKKISIETAIWIDSTATFTIPLTYDDLVETINEASMDQYRLVLYSGFDNNNNNNKNRELATLDITPAELARISPGTRAIIEWSMKVTDTGGN